MLKSIKKLGLFGKILFLFILIFFGATITVLGYQLIANSGEEDILVLKTTQAATSIFAFLLPALLCGYLWYETPALGYSADRLPSRKLILMTLGLIIAVSPFISLLARLNEQLVLPQSMKAIEEYFRIMEDDAEAITKKLLTVNTFWGLLGNLLVIALLPAMAEEFLFRGTLFRIFSEKIKNQHVLVWLVAAIFSFIHFQFYGFLPRMILGAVLGYLMIWSDSIWLSVIAHFINNAMAVLIFYFNNNSMELEAFENTSSTGLWILGLLSLLVSAWILSQIKNQTEL